MSAQLERATVWPCSSQHRRKAEENARPTAEMGTVVVVIYIVVLPNVCWVPSKGREKREAARSSSCCEESFVSGRLCGSEGGDDGLRVPAR